MWRCESSPCAVGHGGNANCFGRDNEVTRHDLRRRSLGKYRFKFKLVCDFRFAKWDRPNAEMQKSLSCQSKSKSRSIILQTKYVEKIDLSNGDYQPRPSQNWWYSSVGYLPNSDIRVRTGGRCVRGTSA